MQVTSVDLHRHFHVLGAGVIEDVRVQRDKGFGFVRYSTHAEAARAIQLGNARVIYGKPIKVTLYDLLISLLPFHFSIWFSFVSFCKLSALVHFFSAFSNSNWIWCYSNY